MGMPSFPGNGGDDDLVPLSEINITPFVDVVLVLLIIFMVAAPLMTASVPVDLPKLSQAPAPPLKEPLDVSIGKDGSVWVMDDEMTGPGMLDARLAELHRDAPERTVSLRGDASVAYGRLMTVMDAIQKAGFTKVSLAADPRD